MQAIIGPERSAGVVQARGRLPAPRFRGRRAGSRYGDTVWVRVADVLVRTPELPPYVTVIGWLPLLSVEVVNVACPAALRVAVPSVLFLSLKVTVPVGSPKPGALAATVAVKVTACPCREGLSEDTTVVVVPSLFTVWVTAVEVLPLKLALPP